MTDLHYSITYLDPFQYEDESAYLSIDHPQTDRHDVAGLGPMTKEQFSDYIAHNDYPIFNFMLFQQPGVVALNVQYHQIWVMKSPMFSWFELWAAMFSYIAAGFGNHIELPGSADIFGNGKRFTVHQQQHMGIKR